jgi:hypothetical protein
MESMDVSEGAIDRSRNAPMAIYLAPERFSEMIARNTNPPGSNIRRKISGKHFPINILD